MSVRRTAVCVLGGGLGCLVLWFVLALPHPVAPLPPPVVPAIVPEPAAAVPEPTAAAPTPTATEPVELNLVELRAGMTSFAGRRVRVAGFVRSGGRIPAGRLLLYRFRFHGCAAHTAEPVPVAVFVEPPPGGAAPPDETWLEVEGIPSWEVLDGQRVPVVRASVLREPPPPPDSCLH